MNIWIPDGSKDQPYDRFGPRRRLIEALDEVIAVPIPRELHRDAVEGKLFGIGAESYTVGSNEFYLAYAASRKIMLCLDTGHFHPTEVVSDKLSAALGFVDDILLQLSRGVRWDSDHVVLLDDETRPSPTRSSAAACSIGSRSGSTSSMRASTASPPG